MAYRKGSLKDFLLLSYGNLSYSESITSCAGNRTNKIAEKVGNMNFDGVSEDGNWTNKDCNILMCDSICDKALCMITSQGEVESRWGLNNSEMYLFGLFKYAFKDSEMRTVREWEDRISSFFREEERHCKPGRKQNRDRVEEEAIHLRCTNFR